MWEGRASEGPPEGGCPSTNPLYTFENLLPNLHSYLDSVSTCQNIETESEPAIYSICSDLSHIQNMISIRQCFGRLICLNFCKMQKAYLPFYFHIIIVITSDSRWIILSLLPTAFYFVVAHNLMNSIASALTS